MAHAMFNTTVYIKFDVLYDSPRYRILEYPRKYILYDHPDWGDWLYMCSQLVPGSSPPLLKGGPGDEVT